MKAVVLAAGRGRRFGKKLKPLAKVAGREIILRNFIMLSRLGVEEFIIVGSNNKIKEFLERYDFKFRFILNESPEKGNGYSLYLARDYVDDDFVLIMGDHVYDKEFLKRAIKGRGLIGDRIGKFVSLEEATKVKCRNGKVERTGKNLDKWDYIDTGFFVLSPEIFRYAAGIVCKKEEVNLCEIIERAKPEITEVSGYFWMDIDTPDDLQKARKEIVRLSVKAEGDGFISRNLNRKISTRISERLSDHVTPSFMTLLSFLIGLLSCFLVFVNRPAAGIIYQLSSILDGVDGEIARASMRESRIGGWLDSILDRYIDFLFLLFLAIVSKAWFFAALAIFGSVMVSYSTERYRASFGEDAYRIKAMRYLLGKRDERIFVIMIFCIFNLIAELLIVIAVVANIRVLLTILVIYKEKSDS
ncbi:MAG TPA: CDP-alcohol phosphatidyltransferase [Archaeoglobaceae archaeon]|nr:CDP-alcohol phosphatidyltransferase [Archaeoglobaceae archaeon]